MTRTPTHAPVERVSYSSPTPSTRPTTQTTARAGRPAWTSSRRRSPRSPRPATRRPDAPPAAGRRSHRAVRVGADNRVTYSDQHPSAAHPHRHRPVQPSALDHMPTGVGFAHRSRRGHVRHSDSLTMSSTSSPADATSALGRTRRPSGVGGRPRRRGRDSFRGRLRPVRRAHRPRSSANKPVIPCRITVPAGHLEPPRPDVQDEHFPQRVRRIPDTSHTHIASSRLTAPEQDPNTPRGPRTEADPYGCEKPSHDG